MSLHYEWTLSLRLRPDAPAAFLDEVRYHLGLTDQPPADPSLDADWPCLAVDPADDRLPGGGAGSLIEQHPYLNRPACFGLYVRLYMLDDAMYDLVQIVPRWLARWSLTQGWIGVAREELALNPWLNFYVQDGHAYAAEPGGTPKPFDDTAPPFTLSQTTDLP
ncbi:hypothetical protein OHA72_43560 [Dactylosporangium sp. NBC_01737]|uniref:hypothetical protein n=1 Tax=Dactylosporangium sp. NBC_01737 TaxID=2975959 RepID=UPI002E10E74E|nr:hypothetical protein OHA72_43560 [Dactylosporangium sp. NBC_01737]